MRWRRRRAVKLWRGRPARECVLTVDVDGRALVTAPWVRPEPCVRCGRLTTMRFNEYGTAKMFPVHVECGRVIAEMTAA